MSTKPNPIESLSDVVRKSLSEVVSLKETCTNQAKELEIISQNNDQLTADLKNQKEESGKFQNEIKSLSKELGSQKEAVKKIEGEMQDVKDKLKVAIMENTELSASLKKMKAIAE